MTPSLFRFYIFSLLTIFAFNSFSKEIDFTIHKGDNLVKKLKSYGVSSKDIKKSLFFTKKARKIFNHVYPGQKIHLSIDNLGNLINLKIQFRNGKFYSVTKTFTGDFLGTLGKEIDKIYALPVSYKNYRDTVLSIKKMPLSNGCKNSFLNAFNSYSTRYNKIKDIRVYFLTKESNGHSRNICPLAAKFIIGDSLYTLISIKYKNKYLYFDGKTSEQRNFSFLNRPIKGGIISSVFSKNRIHPILKIRRPHYGIDYADELGTKVYATSSGKVTFAGRNGGYGNFIVIKHNRIYSTRYGHLKKIYVHNGEKVKQMDVIGLMGSTGISTGPHVHYEIRKYGRPLNPITAVRRYPHLNVSKITLANRWKEIKNLVN